ncbi:hypothetical protein [Papillibacter cinnamivorans]|uniref:hypothetical protein n=1 Tax=Papillibacter cinnamivorans TaxID=100176 RepID=UPI0013565690|nr:hypothetical protein [Papillibacter cinnamivorans]
MSTEQMRFFETHLQKEQPLLFLTAKRGRFSVSDALIDFLCDFADTRRKVTVHGF